MSGKRLRNLFALFPQIELAWQLPELLEEHLSIRGCLRKQLWRRHPGELSGLASHQREFGVREEEQLVAEYRSANRAPELVAAKIGQLSSVGVVLK